ncbi:ThiF family adenylyltransferase [Geobacillus zalihae]|nr:ThiF family adenylyltransferase [Geobacillus zalihae]QNU23802.1 ThiF family adenylyltransferase [Geobacillus zalihae]
METKKEILAEFKRLGFSLIDENKVFGSITFGEISIEVTICIDQDFPFKAPIIFLETISGKKELYKNIPYKWRHLDEWVLSQNPRDSKFTICCLHNWVPQGKNNARFICDRIYSWLKSNITETWDPEEDLPTSKIIPKQATVARLILSNEFIESCMKELKPKEKKLYKLIHSKYKFKGTGATSRNGVISNKYALDDIDFNSPYIYFFSDDRETKSTCLDYLINIKSDGGFNHADCLVIRLPSWARFKTLYQLLEYLRVNEYITSKLVRKYNNLPIVVIFRGDKGRTEVVSFLCDKEILNQNGSMKVQMISIDTIPKRQTEIGLNVGLIGVGSLGSNVARLLVNKGVKTLYMSDHDILKPENLGGHILPSMFLYENKANAVANYLMHHLVKETEVYFGNNDEEVFEKADLLVVTVGDNEAFNILAFNKLQNYKKPIIWAWVSPHNIIHKMVITSKKTGCLNCFFLLEKKDKTLRHINEKVNEELSKLDISYIDLCGNPHTVSFPERMVEFAAKIVATISLYAKTKRFEFDYLVEYWDANTSIPTTFTGLLNVDNECGCEGQGRENNV